MSNFVFVLDTNKQPLDPVHPAKARQLLDGKQAAVYRRFPFTIILKEAQPRLEGNRRPTPITVKVDPGSKTTGIALVRADRVVFAAELEHRGQAIKDALESRRAIRRSRRQRQTRYRKPRFLNRTKPKGWLAPSLQSRASNLQTWLVRFLKLCNVQSISMELVRFDTQLMQDAEVSGVEYQQGELTGYEVRGYLLEKFGHKCCYCGKTDIPLEIEHITPKSRGGSNRVSNLCLACWRCNVRKSSQTATEFGHPQVQALAKRPLKDASAVNSVRWAIWQMFSQTGLPVEVGTGGRTKFNRTQQGYPRLEGNRHWIDAACLGRSGRAVNLCPTTKPLAIKAVGRGGRQMCHMDKYGFPRTAAKSGKRFFGFQTGDMVKAIVPTGKNKGVHTGKVAVRSTGSFAILFRKGKIDGINQKYCKRIHAQDGYVYSN